MKKTLGFILIVVGLIALVYGGIEYTSKKKVLDLGPVEVRAEKENKIGWPPIAGAVLLLGGVVLVATSRKK